LNIASFAILCTADLPYLQLQNSRVAISSCDGSLSDVAVEGDDPLEICVRSWGSEGETVKANVIIVDGTTTGTYVLTIIMCSSRLDALSLESLVNVDAVSAVNLAQHRKVKAASGMESEQPEQYLCFKMPW